MCARSGPVDRIRGGAVPDILIVGGGINGAGVFRELAAQCVAALLVDMGDFSSGTSAAPSRLIHGGLRYFETGETALVRESLVEQRTPLLKNARHVVHPQPVRIPLRTWFGGSPSAVLRFFWSKRTPDRKGAVPVALGLTVHELFGRKHRTMPNHRMLRASMARAQIPSLGPDLRAVSEFHDARIGHRERMVLELIADAEAVCPESMAVPCLAADLRTGGQIALEDRLTGETLPDAPRVVINAAGG